jgi:hypothetical protein
MLYYNPTQWDEIAPLQDSVLEVKNVSRQEFIVFLSYQYEISVQIYVLFHVIS